MDGWEIFKQLICLNSRNWIQISIENLDVSGFDFGCDLCIYFNPDTVVRSV